MLTITAAIEYAARTLIGMSDGAITIVGAKTAPIDGVPAIDVFFHEDDSERQIFTVWVEGGKLYGEW
jgi:hypothetical protein